MTWPTLTVSAAFGVDPLTVPTAGQWVDITAYVRQLDWRRGRNHELARTAAGELSIRLRNTDRRFDPTNTAGPYYPNVRPMTRVRVRAVHSAVTYDLFTGYVEDWGQQWAPRPIDSTGDAEVVLQAVDAFKILNLVVLTPYSERVLQDDPVAYWKLDEPAGSGAAINVGSAGEGANLDQPGANSGAGGAETPFVGGQTSWDFEPVVGLETPTAVADLTFPGAEMSIEFYARITLSGFSFDVIDHSGAGGLGNYRIRYLNGSGWRYGHGGAGGVEQFAQFARDPTLDTWEHIVFVRAGSEVQLFIDGALVEAKPNPPARNVVDRELQIGSLQSGQLAHVALYDYALPPERIAAHAAAGFDGFGEQLSGAYIDTILDLIGWPAGERDTDVGASSVQPTLPSGSALDWLLRIAEETEHGLLHITGDGKVRFHDRHTLLKHVTADATIGDNAADGVVYADLEARFDDADLYSEVIVPREGGAEAIASDAAAAASYGPRSLVRPSSLASAAGDVEGVAAWLLSRYKDPALRFETVVLDPFDVDARWTQTLARDIHHDRLTIKRRPPGGGSVIAEDAHIEGVHHRVVPPRSWTVEYSLIPADPETVWILGDATYGVLGSTTRLGP